MNEKENRIKALISQLNHASEIYYNGQDEILSNFEWDQLFDELTRLEQETGLIFDDSPTQTVGVIHQRGTKEAHEFPALSLAKTKNIAELQKWAGDQSIWLSYKEDGITLVATYDQGRLTKLLTRGNGEIGSNITYLKNAVNGLPLTIKEKEHLVVRGEATISYADFDLINLTIEAEDEKYANPRNLVAGTLALDNVEKVKSRKVLFSAFTLVYTEKDIPGWGDRMDFLENNGFNVVDREKTDAEHLPQVVERWTEQVEAGKVPMPVDGLVIVYDDTVFAAEGSVTGHHATRGGLAYKWADVSAISELEYIEWSCAASVITPVAVFKPVQLEGTTVSRASLYNISELERLKIGQAGTKIRCIKSNKIIPKIVEVIDPVGQFEIPEHCPTCGAPTEILTGEFSGTKTLRCINPDCPAKNLQKYARFVSRQGMNIEGLSIKTINKFVNAGYISRFSDFYSLDRFFETIKAMEGFGDKAVANLAEAIENSRSAEAFRFIYALCIPMIGIDAAKKIISTLGLAEFLQRLENDGSFEDIDGIGKEKSDSVIKWYAKADNQEDLHRLLSVLSLQGTEKKAAKQGLCENLTFVVTGKLEHFSNRDELKAYILSENGKVAGSVSNKTDFLINNDSESLSAKNKKARELNIPILTESMFIERFTSQS